jgi:hypothetical protein
MVERMDKVFVNYQVCYKMINTLFFKGFFSLVCALDLCTTVKPYPIHDQLAIMFESWNNIGVSIEKIVGLKIIS